MKLIAVLLLCSVATFAQTAKKPSDVKSELAAANKTIVELQKKVAELKSENDGLISAMKTHYQLLYAYQKSNEKCAKTPISATKANIPEEVK